MDKAAFADALKKLIENQEGIVIKNYDDQLDIDSFCMMLIITFVDESLGVKLDMDTLDFDDFKSINSLTDMIFSKGVTV